MPLLGQPLLGQPNTAGRLYDVLWLSAVWTVGQRGQWRLNRGCMSDDAQGDLTLTIAFIVNLTITIHVTATANTTITIALALTIPTQL